MQVNPLKWYSFDFFSVMFSIPNLPENREQETSLEASGNVMVLFLDILPQYLFVESEQC